jgi:hypothetical protein
MIKKTRLLSLIAALAIFVIACGNNTEKNKTTSTPPPTPTPTPINTPTPTPDPTIWTEDDKKLIYSYLESASSLCEEASNYAAYAAKAWGDGAYYLGDDYYDKTQNVIGEIKKVLSQVKEISSVKENFKPKDAGEPFDDNVGDTVRICDTITEYKPFGDLTVTEVKEWYRKVLELSLYVTVLKAMVY